MGLAMRLKLRTLILVAFLSLGVGKVPLAAQDGSLNELLNRAGISVTRFLDHMNSVTCTEEVLQEKLNANGKARERLQSSFEYLVLQQSQKSEPQLYESRQPVKEARSKTNVSLLVSNGFATELLIFHPFYQPSFTFARLPDVQVNGKTFAQIHFLHVKGRPTPAALQIRGRDYPLSLAGTARIDPASGAVAHVATDLEISMEDLGLKSFHSEVDYTQITFAQQDGAFWLPSEATIEVQTPRQHWKNIHRFIDYHLFSVSTTQQVDVGKIKQKEDK
jgi:hypothetical protein